MGLIKIGDDAKKMQSGEKITFDNLDFIAVQLRNLRLQEPEPPAQQEEQPPPVCAFVAGLEEAMDGEPLTLARHLSRYGCDIFAKTIREHELDVTFQV